MLHCLNQDQLYLELPLRLAPRQLQILHAQAGIPVRGRNDTAVEGNGVALFLDLGLQGAQTGLDFLVGLPVDLAIGLQNCNFLF